MSDNLESVISAGNANIDLAAAPVIIDGEELYLEEEFETEGAEIKRRGMFAEVMSRVIRNKSVIIGFIILFIVVGACLAAPWIAPYSYDEQNLDAKFQKPSAEHLMGTDNFGRDMFTRILYGGRVSLMVGFVSETFSMLVGTILGAISAYYGGRTDNIIMRILDVFMSMPNLLLAIAISATMGPGIVNAMLAVGISSVPRVARVVRAPILAVKSMEYVEAAQSLHASDLRIIFRHILPNVLSPIIVQTTLGVAAAIIAVASLSFLGLGVQPPTPEWGSLLSTSRVYIRQHSYMATYPGLAIALVVIALNLFGDGLRDSLDPRLKN